MTHLLVIGYRAGLLKACERLGVSFVLWDNSSKAKDYGAAERISAPFRTEDQIRAALERFPSSVEVSAVLASGEGSVLAAATAREHFGVSGNSVELAKSCTDKLQMKSLLAAKGIPMTAFLDCADPFDVDKVTLELGEKVVLKERCSSGGRSFRVCRGIEEVEENWQSGLIAERFVDAPEMSVESFVKDGKILFSSATEYFVKKHTNVIPAFGGAHQFLEQIFDINQRVVEALEVDCGMTHVEFYLADEGPLFGEIALRPPGGWIMELMSHVYDFDAWDVFLALGLDGELPDFSKMLPRRAAGVTLMHPGRGVVKSVVGQDLLESHPQVFKFRLKRKPGDIISERLGTGQHCGHYFVAADDHEQLTSTLRQLDSEVKVILAQESEL